MSPFGGGPALGLTAEPPVRHVTTNALDPEIDRAFTVLDTQPPDTTATLDEAFDSVDRQGPDGTWRGEIGGFSPAEILDMHTLSPPGGDSAANAVAKMQREQVFNGLVEEVRRDAPDRYVAASFSSKSATIYVTGDADDFASTKRASLMAVDFVGGISTPRVSCSRSIDRSSREETRRTSRGLLKIWLSLPVWCSRPRERHG